MAVKSLPLKFALIIVRRGIPSTQAWPALEVAARHESYTRAAQELFLTQGAVSRQIQALEVVGRATVSPHTPRRGADARWGRTTAARWRAGCRGWSATRWT